MHFAGNFKHQPQSSSTKSLSLRPRSAASALARLAQIATAVIVQNLGRDSARQSVEMLIRSPWYLKLFGAPALYHKADAQDYNAYLYFGVKEFLQPTFAPHAFGNAEDSVFFGWANGCPFFN
jgi:hypothetical protein